MMLLLLFLEILVSGSRALVSTTGEDRANNTNFETRLTKKMVDDYEVRGVYGRPVQNVQEVIHIGFGLSLVQIINLDEKNQVLTLNVWDNYEWNDTFLWWNPEEYGGLTDVRLPVSKIWRPDIKLYNYADERIDDHRETMAIVYHHGLVKWIPQVIYKSSCPIDIKYFPYDEQYCSLKFGSWTYDSSKLELKFVGETFAFDLAHYHINNEWNILENSALKHVIRYSCCPEIFQDVTFKLRLGRRAVFYTYILIIPCVLLSGLTLVLFWIPPESPAKIQLGMNIFVAFFVMLLILEESIPAASSVPLIGTYYCLNMVLITTSSFLNVLVVNLFRHGPRRRVPVIFRKIFVEFLAKAFCIQRSNSHRLQEQTTVQIHNRYKGPDVATTEKFDLEHTHSTIPTQSEASSLENAVSQINYNVNRWTAKSLEKDRKANIAEEWKVIALVLDRIYFVLYLAIAIVALWVLLPR